MKRKLLVTFLALFLSLTFLVSGASAAKLALNHVGATDHPYHFGAEKFAELIKEYSGGSIEIDVFPASQIASGAKAIEMVQTYTLDIAVESTMALSNFVPQVGVLDLPFLFETKQQAFAVLDGPVGKLLDDKAAEAGLKILSWWDNGFRNITSRKGFVKQPSDLVGLKIRTPESTVFLKTFETLGAVPTAMAVAEVFSSLQLGIVDAQENPDANNIRNKYPEVAPYYTITKHIYTAEPVVMNLDAFNAFSEEEQAALLKAAKEAGEYQRKVSLEFDDKNLDYIKESGAQLYIVEDMSAFREACMPVYDFFRADFGELIDMIQKEIAAQ